MPQWSSSSDGGRARRGAICCSHGSSSALDAWDHSEAATGGGATGVYTPVAAGSAIARAGALLASAAVGAGGSGGETIARAGAALRGAAGGANGDGAGAVLTGTADGTNGDGTTTGAGAVLTGTADGTSGGGTTARAGVVTKTVDGTT